MINKETFQRQSVVAKYAGMEYLFPSEEIVLKFVERMERRTSMLDVGVGAGRTTRFFAPLFTRYAACDYAPEMVEECRKKFPQHAKDIHVADARNLEAIASQAHDLVLFSFNGIDYLEMGDRLACLKEMRRVTRDEGCFIFSSHNTQWIGRLAPLIRLNPFTTMTLLYKWLRMRLVNGSFRRLRRQNQVIFRDAAHEFGLKTVYTRPEYQLRELATAGFEVTMIITDHAEIVSRSDLDAITRPSIYYVCKPQ